MSQPTQTPAVSEFDPKKIDLPPCDGYMVCHKERLESLLEEAREQLKDAQVGAMCPVCLGSPINANPCICGGSNHAHDAYTNCLRELDKADRELAELRERQEKAVEILESVTAEWEYHAASKSALALLAVPTAPPEECYECGLPKHMHPGRLCDEFVAAPHEPKAGNKKEDGI